MQWCKCIELIVRACVYNGKPGCEKKQESPLLQPAYPAFSNASQTSIFEGK